MKTKLVLAMLMITIACLNCSSTKRGEHGIKNVNANDSNIVRDTTSLLKGKLRLNSKYPPDNSTNTNQQSNIDTT